jgi:hypothetical protein
LGCRNVAQVLDASLEALAVRVLPTFAVDARVEQALVNVYFATLAREAIVTLALVGFDAVNTCGVVLAIDADTVVYVHFA